MGDNGYSEAWELSHGGTKFYFEGDVIAQTFKLNPYWVEAFPLARWLTACETPAWGLKDADLRPILDELYALFPQPGTATHDEIPVRLERGEDIKEHRHPEWTLVYYVNVGDPPVAILIGDELNRYVPERGTAILMSPNVLHAVEKSESAEPRLSLALRWQQPVIN